MRKIALHVSKTKNVNASIKIWKSHDNQQQFAHSIKLKSFWPFLNDLSTFFDSNKCWNSLDFNIINKIGKSKWKPCFRIAIQMSMSKPFKSIWQWQYWLYGRTRFAFMYFASFHSSWVQSIWFIVWHQRDWETFSRVENIWKFIFLSVVMSKYFVQIQIHLISTLYRMATVVTENSNATISISENLQKNIHSWIHFSEWNLKIVL